MQYRSLSSCNCFFSHSPFLFLCIFFSSPPFSWYLRTLLQVPCCCYMIKYASFFSLVALLQSSSNHSFLFRDSCLPRTSFATCCMVLFYRSHSSCIISPPVQGDSFRHSSNLFTYIFVMFSSCNLDIQNCLILSSLNIFMFDIRAVILAITK